jgi:hypothetical protein
MDDPVVVWAAPSATAVVAAIAMTTAPPTRRFFGKRMSLFSFSR